MSSHDVIIIGSCGMLGRELAEACRLRGRGAWLFDNRAALDITDAAQVSRALGQAQGAVVINAAGYTDVDGAEAQPHLAEQVNRHGSAHLARACRDAGALLVHYSTDFVFNGRADRPYHVDDTPDPLNAYGRTKLGGEREIAAAGCRFLMIRTSWLFAPHGRNFVGTILDLARRKPYLDVIDDQRGRPSYAADVAVTTLELLDRGAEGTFHVANDGECSWFELAGAAVELAGCDCQIRPCVTADMPQPARRPAYSVLDLSGTVALVGRPRHWKDALADCVNKLDGASAR